MLREFLRRRLTVLEKVLEQPEGVLYLGKVVDGTLKRPLLLVGEEGVGRRTSVTEAAKEVFARDQHYALERGQHPDFRLVEGEPYKEIKVDAIREIVAETETAPSWAPWKFLVIDGSDRITAAGANALLKALEEPPPKVRFFLLAEQASAVLPTVRSRCATVSYRCLSEQLIYQRLREHTEDERKALVCTRIAEGSLGRALRCLVSGQLTLRNDVLTILSATLRKDLFAAFSAVNELTELPLAIRFLGQVLRDLLLINAAPGKVVNVDVIEALGRLRAETDRRSLVALFEAVRVVRERLSAPVNLAFHLKAALAVACR